MKRISGIDEKKGMGLRAFKRTLQCYLVRIKGLYYFIMKRKIGGSQICPKSRKISRFAHVGDTRSLEFLFARMNVRYIARIFEAEIIKEYEGVPNGHFAASLMRQDIKKAHAAMMSGDIVGMVATYEALKSYEL